jgi:hypothetical protein
MANPALRMILRVDLSPGEQDAAQAGEIPSGPLAGWKVRPDVNGRLGWERPGLSERDRWWADADFEDLPTPGEPCPVCNGLAFWWNVLGDRRCMKCNPPIKSGRLAQKAVRLPKAATKRMEDEGIPTYGAPRSYRRRRWA